MSELWMFASTQTYSNIQQFTGLSPLLSTFCPIGGFELLGVGKALRTVKRLGRFVFDCLNCVHIIEKLELFVSRSLSGTFSIDFGTHLEGDASLQIALDWQRLADIGGLDEQYRRRDQLDDDPCASMNSGRLSPIAHYFSARHGFQFEGVGVSIPFQVISNANTLQWSLMSLTHEYCHILSRVVLAGTKEYLAESDSVHLNQVREHILDAANSARTGPMTFAGASPIELFAKTLVYRRVASREPNEIERVLQNIDTSELRDEDEIITLLFDLVYFFKGDVEQHLMFYWSHWLGIPGIYAHPARLRTYIARSCCALMADFLLSPRTAKSRSLSPTDLISALVSILTTKAKSLATGPLAEATRLLTSDEFAEANWIDIVSSLPLVASTLALLISREAREVIWRNADANAISSLVNWRKRLSVDYDVLSSQFHPLSFLATDFPDAPANEVESLWMFTVLDAMTDGHR